MEAMIVELLKSHLSYAQEYKTKTQRKIMEGFTLIRQLLLNVHTKSKSSIHRQSREYVKVYNVVIPSDSSKQSRKTRKNSSILRKCEGARGILYMKRVKNQPFYPRCTLKKIKILEVKDVSMKIRTYEHEINHYMIHIEDVLGFLKEVD